MKDYKEILLANEAEAERQLKEAFEFKNTKAPIIINDVNYWLFGELPENIPDGYCSDNPEIMKKYQLDKMEEHVKNFPDDCYQSFLMPWFGTGVLPSGFGTDIICNEKMDPAVDMSKITEPEEISALKMPDPYKDGQMPLVLKAIDHFRETTNLPIGITDCQGPLTTALSIIGYENYIYWMHDYPEAIHELMDKVTDALINWIKVQKEHAGKEVESPEYILGVKLPEGHGNVWIADDDCVIFNDEQYREFVVPYNSRVLKAFGGGGIHYCGVGTQHIESFLVTEGLTCIHNMCLDNLDEAKKMKDGLARKKIPYILGDFVVTDERIDGYYKELFDTIDQTGLIVVPYPAPATALSHGAYMPADRNQVELGKRAKEAIMKYR